MREGKKKSFLKLKVKVTINVTVKHEVLFIDRYLYIARVRPKPVNSLKKSSIFCSQMLL